MIKIFITVNKGADTDEIIASLLMEKWALEVSLNEVVLYSSGDNGKPVCMIQSEIAFITKAMLYSELENWLLSKWGDSITTFHSVPIVNMDKMRAEMVRKGLKSA